MFIVCYSHSMYTDNIYFKIELFIGYIDHVTIVYIV